MAFINNVLMGSGYLYAASSKDISNPFDPTPTDIDKLVDLGYIQANAVLKSAVDKVDVKAANAGKIMSYIKERNVSFSTGIFSFNLENVAKFLTGSEFVEDATTKKQIFTYGNDDKNPNVFLRFVATDESSGKRIIYNLFSCEFNGELTFDHNDDKPVVFDYSFTVMSAKNPTSGKYQYYNVTVEDIA